MSGCYPNKQCYCDCHPALEGCGDCCFQGGDKVSMYTKIRELEIKIENLTKGYVHLHTFGSPVLVESLKVLEGKILENFYPDILNHFEKRIIDLNIEVAAINKQKFSEFHHSSTDIEKLSKRIEEIADFCNRNWKHNKQPHKCPVCDGKGLGEKYADVLIDGVKMQERYSPCNACDGIGVVWR